MPELLAVSVRAALECAASEDFRSSAPVLLSLLCVSRSLSASVLRFFRGEACVTAEVSAERALSFSATAAAAGGAAASVSICTSPSEAAAEEPADELVSAGAVLPRLRCWRVVAASSVELPEDGWSCASDAASKSVKTHHDSERELSVMAQAILSSQAK